ncbi:MAG: hypothetical protein LQ343_007117 [Gyalolechia ehrenbergii]|nr:MAG: hypothetical protein LQ343_007117 [Gyalolechia ehrenbergii]
MALDSSHPLTNKPLPTPTDAPCQVSARSDSRQSSRVRGYSPWPSTSSPQLHVLADSSGYRRGESKDNIRDDKMSIIDARRFTPNLHASLVSEILSLKREVEDKNKALTILEESLHSSKLDNGQLTATVNSQEREIRSVKKQMQHLENGTLSALGDMAKERDDAVAHLTDIRKRLEASKSSVRTHEEDARRNRALREQDKQDWDNERRGMERKLHVAEGRLKTMVNEVAAVQGNNQLGSIAGSDMEEGIGDPWFSNWSDIISTRSSSVRGRYHLSELSNNTYDSNELANLRHSMTAGRNSISGLEPNSLSLADELSFEEAGEDQGMAHKVKNGIVSPDAHPEENPFENRSLSIQSQDHKARRILGLPTDSKDPKDGEFMAQQNSNTTLDKPLPSLQAKKSAPMHRDAGTQFSPPSSPKRSVPEPEALLERDVCRNTNTENTANQRRKRVSAAATPHDALPSRSEGSSGSNTTSAACQTLVQPTSPPLVPMIALEPLFPEPSTLPRLAMVSSSTQTDGESQSASEPAGSRQLSLSNTIPVIAIHPPGSRPGSSYNNVVLPPQTKNASCQTLHASWASSVSAATQTESIQVDQRPLKIPPRLMSAAAPSKPHSQNVHHSLQHPPKSQRADLRSPPPVDAPRTRARPSNIQIRDSHVTNFPIQLGNEAHVHFHTSPNRLDNPFAGFSDQEGSEMGIDLGDDDDFAIIAPIRKTLSKVQNSWKLVPATMNPSLGARPLDWPISDIQEIDDMTEAGPADMQADVGRKLTVPSVGPKAQAKKPELPVNASQNPDIRKATLILREALAHTRQRSPSEPGPSTALSTVPPPFPVPTRSSSRKIPISSSEGNGSPTHYGTSFIAGIRNRTKALPTSRNPLRKVRSAAAVPKFAPEKGTPAGPDSAASTSLGSSRLPRILRSGITQQSNASLQKLEPEASVSGFTVPESAFESPSQTTSVVDAIAQTMVGEWMLKYVRKRKSFGIAESAQVEFEQGRNYNESSSGIRHKRWVWLVPYERAVIWSSKQPTSGSALMGKGGRKFTIQSVLDVKDGTPLPKNSGFHSNFGRSILILTPQRALKFTAPNRERHYIWLTALSFLSHCKIGMEGLGVIPAVPRTEDRLPSLQARGRVRRSPRDSIRIAKSKERPHLQARNYTAPTVATASKAFTEDSTYERANESVSDAAEPPQIRRVSAHVRKRSNTGPRPSLPSAFHSFPAQLGIPSSPNVRNATPPDIQPDMGRPVTRGFQGSISGSFQAPHISETAIPQPSPIRNDFFDAVGTVRMEAFVDNSKQEAAEAGNGQSMPRSSYRPRQGRKKDMSYWGIMGETSGPQGKKSGWRVDDPFQGF